MMQQVIEKSFLDWSRSKNQKIQARGIAAILEQKAKIVAQNQMTQNSRCVWPSVFDNRETRYLSRKMWIS